MTFSNSSHKISASQKTLERILKGLVNSLEMVGYCQGMSLLALNLYDYLKNEEVNLYL